MDVVVQYMARWMKCPLPLPLNPLPSPPPPPDTLLPDPPAPGPPSENKEDKEELVIFRQGTSHCSCLEHCFLFRTPRITHFVIQSL